MAGRAYVLKKGRVVHAVPMRELVLGSVQAIALQMGVAAVLRELSAEYVAQADGVRPGQTFVFQQQGLKHEIVYCTSVQPQNRASSSTAFCIPR